MAKLALYTFGIFQQPRDHEQLKGFHDRNPFVYASAENSEGFSDRSGNSRKRNHADRNADWGIRDVSPRFLTTDAHRDTAATLSLWDDVESVYAFTYYGFHAEVLKKRDEWFVKGEWPAFVAWWIPDDETPTRAEGSTRLEHLHDNRPTAHAFDFKKPFDADGQPLTMDRDKIRHHAEIVRSHMRHD
ncbi:MAG: DUF3291 domain-containing protein [Chloroflexi bacterium]|nr:DUF3291 domain-containing protein [Chloroflexota bacterium]